ncbi:hypothetical protein SAMN02982917_0563 [Azospirillum oryzae]|uniref:Uncharacterized protein n=1 Tax=Azospirillum oryzae TaxID=286727 RepID=A0A1X7HST8_9PROT|nr:hypothetical protein [Azospirillum oryzae]SMF92327.1 hypothetical protein SAMN02982917_0563 [Azospirillum oryzae]
MTLILTHASRDGVFQTSDRLITRDGVALDRVSNKTVIFVAIDGVFVMSYTGAAFLEGLPTDQRIAEILHGKSMTVGGRVPSIGQQDKDISLRYRPCLRKLRDSLTSAFRRASKPQKKILFSLCVAGFELVNNRYTPVFDVIHKKPNSTECVIKRNRDVSRSRGAIHAFDHSPNVHLSELVHSHLSSVKINSSCEAITNQQVDPATISSGYSGLMFGLNIPGSDFNNSNQPSRNPIIREFVTATRVASSRSSTVGPHCMSVTIGANCQRKVMVEFIPSEPHAVNMADINQIIQVAYTPAVIHPWGFLAASHISGSGSTLKVGGWDVEFHGIPIHPVVPVYLAGQRRPKPY